MALFWTLQAPEGNNNLNDRDYYITASMFMKSLGFTHLNAMNFQDNKGNFL